METYDVRQKKPYIHLRFREVGNTKLEVLTNRKNRGQTAGKHMRIQSFNGM
jgi:hypothetical protein